MTGERIMDSSNGRYLACVLRALRLRQPLHDLHQRPASRRPFLECLEDRVVPSGSTTATGYRSDGKANNLADPSLGSAGTDLLRISPVAIALRPGPGSH
jgi:hypothetical protein